MRKARVLLIVFVVVLLAFAVIVEAQQPSKMPRIGYLGAFTPSAGAPLLEAFRQAMRELGYVEGRNIFIDYRWAEGTPDQFPALAGELINLRVDVIVTQSNAAVAALQQATRTIPNRHGDQWRSCWSGARHQPCPSGREHYRVLE